MGYACPGPITISNCYSTASVSGTCCDNGGLVGTTSVDSNISDIIISNCYATGNVSADAESGGLIGCNLATVTNCYATGNVVVTWYDAGG